MRFAGQCVAMVFRLVKKISAAVSLVLLVAVIWLIYLLVQHQPSLNLSHRGAHSPHQFNNHPSGERNLISLDEIESHGQKTGTTVFNKSISQSQITQVSILLSNISDFKHLDTVRGRDYLSRIKTSCRDRICSEWLSEKDRPHFKYCVHKTWQVPVRGYHEPTNSHCVFINGSNRYTWALASYPGSGNTWVRGLLQRVTGLCIGAIYCDVALRKNGYPGESIRSGVAFMVKTHQVDPRWEGVQYAPDAPFTYFKTLEHVPVYSGGVFIMRNPFHAMVAEFKRQAWEDEMDHHIKTLRPEFFGNNTRWDSFVRVQAIVWQQTVLGWLVHNQSHPVLVTKYEDMQQDTGRELERILSFLQVPYSRERLRVVVEEGYSEYHRRSEREFEHYTRSQREYVGGIIRRTREVVGDAGYVEDYLNFV